MPNYLFYPYRADGGCLTFVCARLVDDAAALAQASAVLDEHPSADHVRVWQDERPIGRQVRRSSDTRPPDRPFNVLVVEDDFLLADDLRAALRGRGVQTVTCAADEAAALAAIGDHAPDAAIVDLNLGAGQSFAVAQVLRDRAVPFLFVTGYEASAIPDPWLQVPRLLKPVAGARVVDACLELWAARAAAPVHRAGAPSDRV
jgi:CheY-like chemotaxis protein